MEGNKEKWSKNLFFTLATIGAAVGLGNLWRFPYMAYENGGGSFFIPFIICYLLVGIPIVLLEFGMGVWSQGSVASTFKKLNPKLTWIGWWILLNSVVIVAYYAVVMAWSLQYAIYSLNEAWGTDTAGFFFSKVLRITASPTDWSGMNLFSVFCLFIIWAASYFIVRTGIKGLSKALLFTVPIPFLIIVVLALRGISLPGGKEGVAFFFKPEMSKVFTISVWAAAASQVILSLSLGMGQMVAYASKTKQNHKGIKTAFSLISGDFLFSLFSGITVFATLGAMQHGNMNVGTGFSGPALAFITYPSAISALPHAPLWGFLFFFMLVLLGIDSVFAVIEANLTDLTSVFIKTSRNKLLLLFCSFCFIAGLIFTTGPGMHWLSIVDHWVGYFSIFSIIILQCIVFGNTRKIIEIRSIIGQWISNISVRKRILPVWKFWVGIALPVIFCIILFTQIRVEFSKPYEGYKWSAIILGGWGIFLLTIIVGIFFAVKHNKSKEE
jgi:NSS family neurotransmitter:Na+ symporter